jgi:hypothetical protein
VNLDEIAARLPRTPHPEVVSLYAKLIGELMFIAINTQPLIAQPVNALARFMTTANSELYVLAKGESVLFIGTQFSNLYTAVDTPAMGRVV